MRQVDMQTIHLIAGLGKTGFSMARYLKRRQVPFMVFDTRKAPPGLSEFQAEFPEIKIFLQQLPEDMYACISTILMSPGIAQDLPMIQRAKSLNIPVKGDIECLLEEIQTSKVPLLAITGTNGKSTVTTLVGEMTKAQGLSVAVAGNIGLPVLDILEVGVPYELWVLELSSFQLEYTQSLASTAATILNITPDHLDRHRTFDEYKRIKHSVYQNAQWIITNREDLNTLPGEGMDTSRNISFGLDAPRMANHWGLIQGEGNIYLAKGNECILSVDEMKIKGCHNWLNALAACALAETVGIQKNAMQAVLRRFGGLPHRSQWVRTIEGVDWINDSKGTNVGATISAVTGLGSAMKGRIVLIVGGQGKGADFSLLRSSCKNYIRSMILIGEDAARIEAALFDVVPMTHAATLEEAVFQAKAHACPGDIVLLSPACASFDMFRDFNQRGDDFMQIVGDL